MAGILCKERCYVKNEILCKERCCLLLPLSFLWLNEYLYTTRPEKAFITTRFHDWKHATGSKGMLLSHNNCISHKQAVVAWEQFRATFKTRSVAEQLGSNRTEQIKKNRPLHQYES